MSRTRTNNPWTTGHSPGRRKACLFTAALACSAASHAATVDARLVFNASGQSQWTNGAAIDFSTHGPQFLGIPGFSAGDTIGAIDEHCIGPICERTGAKIGATITGRAGLNYDVTINNGSLTVTLPQRVSFSVPDALAIKQGGAFDIVSTLVPTTTLTIFSDRLSLDGHGNSTVVRPRLQTTGPTVQALVGMELNAQAEAVAQACFVVYCVGPNLNVGIDKTQELLALNNNGDRQLRVLGEPIVSAETTQTFDDDAISVVARLPTLNTDSRALVDGFDGNLLKSGNRAFVLGLVANLDQIVSDLLGLPPLNGTSDGFGYNLLTADAGLNIDIKQSFSFDPNLMATLDFTSPVLQRIDGTFGAAPATTSVTFRVGETVTLRAPSALSLGIAPTYSLDNSTRNDTALQVDGGLNLSAGSIDIFGETLGPLVRESTGGALATIPLYGNDFRVNVADIRTDPFNIAFAFANDVAFADTCFAVDPDACDRGGLFSFNPPVCVFSCTQMPSSPIYRIADIYSRLDTSPLGNDCVRFDALGRPCDNAFATGTILPELIALADTLNVGSTSEFAFDGEGNRVFLNVPVATLLDDALLAVTNDTDADAAERLASLGFTGDFRAVDLPRGVLTLPPVDVTAPGMPGVLATGLIGLALLRSRRRFGAGASGIHAERAAMAT